jgi:hypothetical protein
MLNAKNVLLQQGSNANLKIARLNIAGSGRSRQQDFFLGGPFHPPEPAGGFPAGQRHLPRGPQHLPGQTQLDQRSFGEKPTLDPGDDLTHDLHLAGTK